MIWKPCSETLYNEHEYTRGGQGKKRCEKDRT